MFTPKYTPIVVPEIVPLPYAGESVCVPTTPDGVPDSYVKSVEATISKGKEVISVEEQAGKIIFAEEGQKFFKLIK